MRIKYFNETDTAIIEFNKGIVAETKELSENLYIDIDAKGNPVSLTVEHAKQTASLPDFSFQQIESNN